MRVMKILSASRSVHDRIKVSACSIQMRKIRALGIEYKGEIGSDKHDPIQTFALDQGMRQSAQCLKLGRGSFFVLYDLTVDTSDLVDLFWSWDDNICNLLQAAEEPGFDGDAGSKNSNPAKLAACNFVVDGFEQANERKRSSLLQLLGAYLRGNAE
jgi:hypothetical protein